MNETRQSTEKRFSEAASENKKKWVIDPEAAKVVKSVFKMCLEGKGNETIARILQEKQILVPMAYWQSKGLPRGGKKTQPNPYKWCKTTIQKILSQQEYCGDESTSRPAQSLLRTKQDFRTIPRIGQYSGMFTSRLLHGVISKRYRRS